MTPMNLTTVAVFVDVNEARIALNRLHSDGIKAWLANETIVTNDWLLGQAVGNVQLQVAEDDFERASQALALKTELSSAELEELALNAESEEPGKPLFKFFYPDIEEDTESALLVSTQNLEKARSNSDDANLDDASNTREVLVDRCFRAGILFLVLPFLAPLLTWMLLCVWMDEQPLSIRHQRKLRWAVILHLPSLLFFLYFVRGLVQASVAA